MNRRVWQLQDAARCAVPELRDAATAVGEAIGTGMPPEEFGVLLTRRGQAFTALLAAIDALADAVTTEGGAR